MGWSGSIKTEAGPHEFERSASQAVAAAVLVALGVLPEDLQKTRKHQLTKLGQTVDLLVSLQLTKVERRGPHAAHIPPVPPAPPIASQPSVSLPRPHRIGVIGPEIRPDQLAQVGKLPKGKKPKLPKKPLLSGLSRSF
jgi:hypothetical protein